MPREKHQDKIQKIREWLKQENIPNARQDEETILKFLIGCKHQTETAKRKMKNFFEMRRTSPEIHDGRDPHCKNLQTLLDLGVFLSFPLKPPEGHTLVLVKAGVHDPKVIPMTDVFKIGVMSIDLLMELEESITEKGVWLVIDLKGVGFRHALQMTPALISKMVHMWQDCYPIRIKGIDLVNVPRGIDVVLNIFHRFLSKNLRRRLRTHGSQLDSFHAVVHPRFLPEEYGGTLESESSLIENWKKKVQEYREWFLNDETLK